MVTVNITNFGKNLLVRALYNEAPINFVSMKFGNGDVPEDYEELTELVNPLLEVSLTEMTKGDNFIQLTCVFDNSAVETEFNMTEIGVFAEDLELGKGMFAYVNQENDPEPIKAQSSNKLKENSISVQILVDDTKNITATIKSLAFATKADLENHIQDYNNPHKVTKEQVGLGNVENYAVPDTPIKFKESQNLENIESEESVATLFGKIYSAIKALLRHLDDFKNPHKITALDIKAAAEGHTHSTSDLHSGTLSVNRGGTGKGEWTPNQLLFAENKTTIEQIPAPESEAILIQNKGEQPHFVPLSALKFFDVTTTPPEQHNIFWVDTTPITGGLKYYNGTDWTHVPVAYTK